MERLLDQHAQQILQEYRDNLPEFEKQALASFYEAMGSVFREGFGTGSKTHENVLNGIAGLLFGKPEKKSN